MMYPGDMNMNYLDFQKVFQCFLKERQNFCNFCKTCAKCKRVRQLCYEYDGIILNSNRKFGRYTTVVRVNAENRRYPKTFCMTVDIYNSRIIEENEDNLFLEQIKVYEQKFLKVVNDFRKVKLW